MRVVINACFGGFNLSDEAFKLYKEYGGTAVRSYIIHRTDPILLKVVDELGEERCSDSLSELKVIEIPDDVSWHIAEYDGYEHVAENHRTWESE
jgi:hypothetical protein